MGIVGSVLGGLLLSLCLKYVCLRECSLHGPGTVQQGGVSSLPTSAFRSEALFRDPIPEPSETSPRAADGGIGRLVLQRNCACAWQIMAKTLSQASIRILLSALCLGPLACGSHAKRILLLPTALDASHIFTQLRIFDELTHRDHGHEVKVPSQVFVCYRTVL